IAVGLVETQPRPGSARGPIIPVSVSMDAQDTLAQVVSKTVEAVRQAGYGAQSPRASAAPGAAPVVILAGGSVDREWKIRTLGTTDLVLEVVKEKKWVSLRGIYDGHRFDKTCMGRLIDQIATALAGFSADRTQQVKSLQILPEAERQRLLLECCPGEKAPRPEKTVIDLLEEQATRTPDRRAYICDDEVFTYEQGMGKANSLAHELEEMGVVKGDVVPMLLEQSLDLIVSALALMKLGAVFVPFDLKWPAARIQRLVAGLAPRVILKDEGVSLPGASTAPMRPVDWSALPVSPEGPRNAVGPDDPIYGYYTSGSTGLPKCAINVHRGIVNRFLYMTKRYRANGNEVILQNRSTSSTRGSGRSSGL